MKEKSISDDADELFYIRIALVFANSINVFARMILHEFFCHKKGALHHFNALISSIMVRIISGLPVTQNFITAFQNVHIS